MEKVEKRYRKVHGTFFGFAARGSGSSGGIGGRKNPLRNGTVPIRNPFRFHSDSEAEGNIEK